MAKKKWIYLELEWEMCARERIEWRILLWNMDVEWAIDEAKFHLTALRGVQKKEMAN